MSDNKTTLKGSASSLPKFDDVFSAGEPVGNLPKFDDVFSGGEEQQQQGDLPKFDDVFSGGITGNTAPSPVPPPDNWAYNAGKALREAPIVKETAASINNPKHAQAQAFEAGKGALHGIANTSDILAGLANLGRRSNLGTAGQVGQIADMFGKLGYQIPDAPSNLAPQFEKAFPPSMPGTYGAGSGAAELAAQFLIPGAKERTGLGIVKTAARDFLYGGATLGAQSIGEQYARTKNVDPAQALATFLGGGAINTALLGTGRGIAKMFRKKSVAPVPADNAAVAPLPSQVIDPALLEGDDLAAHQLLSGPLPAPPQKPRVSLSKAAAQSGLREAPTNPVEPPAPPEGQTIQGHIETNVTAPENAPEFRLTTDEYGLDRIKTASDLDEILDKLKASPLVNYSELKAGLQVAIQRFAQKKLADATLLDFAERVMGAYSPNAATARANGVQIVKRVETAIPFWIKEAVQQKRFELAESTYEKAEKTIAGLLGGKFGDGGYPIEQIPLTLNKDVDFAKVMQLNLEAKAAEKAYNEAKKLLQPQFEPAVQALRLATNPTHPFHVKQTIEHPLGAQYGTVESSIEFKHRSLGLKLDAKAEAEVKALEQALLSDQRNIRTKNTYKISKSNKAIIAGATALAAADQSARADDGSPEQDANPTGLQIALFAVATAAGIRYGKPALRAFLRNSYKLTSLYRDTVDHIEYLDKMLGTNIAREIWMHQAAALKANWGIKWNSQEEKALAFELLKSKEVTATQALLGLPGTIFEHLTEEQRKAVVEFYLNRQTLAKKIVQHLELAQNWQGPRKSNGLYNEAVSALSHMNAVLNPMGGAIQNEYDKALQKALANAMELFFRLNFKFHLTNLTDPFIAGGARVGPVKIWQAQVLRNADADIKRLFANSNIVGSFKAEQIQQTVQAGGPQSLLAKVNAFDLPSDRYNGEVMVIASLLQHFESNPEAMQKAGISSGVDLVKKLFDPQSTIDPTLAMQALSHAAEVGSRTLGIDGFRINTNVISRMAQAPAFGVFVKQPARISRLVYHSLFVERNPGGAATLLFYTGLFGGSAVVPKDIRMVWAGIDPNSWFQCKEILDKANVVRNLTGMDMSNKLDWGVLYPIFSAVNPAIETAKGTSEHVGAFIQALGAMSDENNWSDPKTAPVMLKTARLMFGDVATIALARIGILPTKYLLDTAKIAEHQMSGIYPVSYMSIGERKSEKLDTEKYDLGFAELANEFLPGTPDFQSKLIDAENEAKLRKLRGQETDTPVYNKNDILEQLRR